MGNVPPEQSPISHPTSSLAPTRLRKTRSGRGQLGDSGPSIDLRDACGPEDALLAAWQSIELLDVPHPLRSKPIEIRCRMESAAELDTKDSENMSPHPSEPKYLDTNFPRAAAPSSPPKAARSTMDPGQYRQLMAGCKTAKERAEKARRLEAMRRAGVDLSTIPVC
eukprot:GGOE01004298.1.p3 GENE.GGOE01004298.1~~GGOE01004298.1.p3  ORF type:complete len:166 (-),score=21.55 GGOE01004298.1:743-1240(-)